MSTPTAPRSQRNIGSQSSRFGFLDDNLGSPNPLDVAAVFQPQISWKNPEDLTPNGRNPRTHSTKQVAQIAASIRQFDFVVPIVVDDNNRILAGHGRLAAANLLQLSRVPVIIIEHLTDEQRRAFVIADNRLAELAGWDQALLAVELQELSELDLDFDVEITGFETAEIDLLIDELDTHAADDADHFPPQSETTPAVSRLGDVWQMGDHRLICGNALEAETFEGLLDGEEADAVFIDPPYNVRIDGHVGGLGSIHHGAFPMACGEMSETEFTEFLQAALTTVSRHCIDGAVLFICMDWRHLYELQTAARQAGLSMLNLCVWAKTNAGMGSFYRSQHELVFVFKKGSEPHTNNVQLGRYGRYRTNVWRYEGANSISPNRRAELAMHPTVKPVALVSDAIKDVTRRGDLVLDGFAGSGTTVLAAQRPGRRCYGIELDPGYVDVAIRRWQNLTGEDAVHANLDMTFAELAETRTATTRRCRKRRKPVEA